MRCTLTAAKVDMVHSGSLKFGTLIVEERTAASENSFLFSSAGLATCHRPFSFLGVAVWRG